MLSIAEVKLWSEIFNKSQKEANQLTLFLGVVDHIYIKLSILQEIYILHAQTIIWTLKKSFYNSIHLHRSPFILIIHRKNGVSAPLKCRPADHCLT